MSLWLDESVDAWISFGILLFEHKETLDSRPSRVSRRPAMAMEKLDQDDRDLALEAFRISLTLSEETERVMLDSLDEKLISLLKTNMTRKLDLELNLASITTPSKMIWEQQELERNKERKRKGELPHPIVRRIRSSQEERTRFQALEKIHGKITTDLIHHRLQKMVEKQDGGTVIIADEDPKYDGELLRKKKKCIYCDSWLYVTIPKTWYDTVIKSRNPNISFELFQKRHIIQVVLKSHGEISIESTMCGW